MYTRTLMWTTLGALALVAPQSLARQQSGQDSKTDAYAQHQQSAPSAKPMADEHRAHTFLPLAKIDGADVRMRAQYDEDGDAKRPKGEVDDVLLRPSDGSLEWAIISFDETLGMGGKTVAIPMSELTWNSKEECFDLAATKAQLEALPPFDLDEARRTGLEQAVEVIEASWTSVRNASATTGKGESMEHAGTDGHPAQGKPGRIVRDEFVAVAVPVRYAVASELDDIDVQANDEKFGQVARCLFDCSNGELAYVVVSRGGVAGIGDEKYLLPFHSLQLCQQEGDDDLMLCIDRGVEELKRVKYEEPHEGVLDVETARRADEAFRS